jgi:hypothetical protein
VISLNTRKIAADPYLVGVSNELKANYQLTVTAPIQGFTITQLKDDLVGLLTLLTASSNAKLLQYLGGEI